MSRMMKKGNSGSCLGNQPMKTHNECNVKLHVMNARLHLEADKAIVQQLNNKAVSLLLTARLHNTREKGSGETVKANVGHTISRIRRGLPAFIRRVNGHETNARRMQKNPSRRCSEVTGANGDRATKDVETETPHAALHLSFCA